MRADLHLHSAYSDGTCTPWELAKRVKEAGVALFSVTDHDSLEGAEEKLAAARAEGLRYASGWEISAYRGDRVHVLGYACKRGDAYFDFLKKRTEGARLRADDMRRKANAYLNLNVTMEEVESFHDKKQTPIHAMHVVRAFASVLQTDPTALYVELFNRGKPANSSLCRPTPEEAIDVIHASGGIAVLAHPGRILLGMDERVSLLEELVKAGLDGIECTYTTHTSYETEAYGSFAQQHRLLVTGGSDFHTDDGKHIIGQPLFEGNDRLLCALSDHGGLF